MKKMTMRFTRWNKKIIKEELLMKKKLMATLLAIALLATCLAGCSNSTDDKTTAADNKTTVAPSGDKTTEGGEATTAEAEDITLKVWLCIKASNKIVEPSEIEVIKQIDEEIGVTTEWTVIKADAWDTQLTLMMNSGEYPDLIISRNGKVDVAAYGVDQGILVPVEDLVAEYMPNYTDRIAECDYDPTVSLKASDGHTYTIGYMSAEDISVWALYYLNQAWLKNLNLQTPTNVEQLTDVLRAFKTQDPNGNNKADEIPLTLTMDIGGTANSGIGQMLPLFGIPFGGANSWLYVDDDAQVQFIPTQDGFRKCMEWLHTLYVEELLDIEALSQDNAALTRKLEDNVVGFCTLWRAANGTTFAETAGKDLALWTPGEGAVIYHYLELASPRVYLTKTNAYPEKTVQWLNSYIDTENMATAMYGRQNQEKNPDYAGWYYTEDNKIATHTPTGTAPVLNDYLSGNGLFFAPGPYKTATMVNSANAIERTEASNVYENADILQKYSNDYLKTVALTPEQSEEKTLMEADMNTAIKEYIAKFIMEGVSDSKWYEFVGIMNSIGCDDYVDMHQEALDTLGLNK